MSLPALIGFAGVLVAAVATGLLAGRAVRRPRLDMILWTGATLALTVALAAQSMGFASGFGPATFRAVQLFALLLAPLWLAWGLGELSWPSEAARFGTRLACGALTVVGSVILATDPLTAEPFGKAWPLAGPHYLPPSHYALDVVQAVAVILAVAGIGLAAARARNAPWPGALPGTAAVGLAVFMTVGLRFSLPATSAYPLLCLLAAALAWYGATRLEPQPGRAGRAAAGRSRAPGGDQAGRDQAGRDSITGRDRTDGRDQTGRDRVVDRDETGRDRADRERAGRDRMTGRDAGVSAADGYERREAQYPPNSQRGPRTPGELRPPGDLRASGAPGPWTDPVRRPPGAPRPDWPRTGPGPDGRPLAPSQMPPSDSVFSRAPAASLGEADFARPAGPELPAAPPYGRILIFTLLDDRVADFDRLAEQTAEEVRTREPDTLVYVIHVVPKAPMQRIFYEIYRDRAAFDSHENQPYMKRFVADRRACVLATNVIELTLKYAKVAPLPGPPSAAQPGPAVPAAPRGQLPPGQPPEAPRPQSLEPLPPRPDRWLPSAERRYGRM